MTTKFTASNGIEIKISEAGSLYANDGGIASASAGPKEVEALREYFQHERDQELGRWRDPDNRDLVVYRRPGIDNSEGRAVLVLDDSTGVTFTHWEKHGLDGQCTPRYEKGQAAAGRYFAAHPETKPWDEAEPGEIWELTDAEGREQLWVKDERLWRSIHSTKTTYYNAKNATAGRRIWPEED